MKKYRYNRIPTKLSEDDFNEFILPHLSKGKRGKPTKLSYYKIFHYILKLLHTGCQWAEIPIDKDKNGNPEIHHTRIFKIFQRWVNDKCFEQIFGNSVSKLLATGKLDLSIIHGDGTGTAAKKGVII